MRDYIHVLARGVLIHQNCILLCRTRDLKTNFYFLPGGHIEHNETAEGALIRELQEEIGFSFTIDRFLGVLEHRFEPDHNSICHNHEYNLIFQVSCDGLLSDFPVQSQEKPLDIIWIPVTDLKTIDFRPESLKTRIPNWIDSPLRDVFYSQG